MRGVTWKFRQGMNTWEGTVKGDKEPLLFIGGKLYVTDLREFRNSETWTSPKHYKITDLTLEQAKELAEDLVNNINVEKHESNRLAWIAENERSVKVIAEAQEYLNKLKNE